MSSSRRSFLKVAAWSLVSLPLFAGLGWVSRAFAADADLPPVSADDPTAKALSFCLDANKPTAQCALRKGKDKKDQYCRGCQLYTKVKGEGKAEMGKCVVLAKGLVPGDGWCNSWVQRPS